MEKKLRILMPFVRSTYGGSFISAALLAKGLVNRKHSVTAIFPCPGVASDLFQSHGIEVRFITAPEIFQKDSSLKSQLKLVLSLLSTCVKSYTVLKKREFDIIHCNDDTTLLAWGLSAKAFHLPLVWHVRHARSGLADFVRSKISNVTIPISDYAALRLKKIGSDDTVIYNPVDLRVFSKNNNKRLLREKLSLNTEGFILVQIGRDIAYKRPEWSAIALRSLIEAGHQVQLVYLGPFSEKRKNELRQIAGVDKGDIVFAGWVDTPEDYLNASDLLLHPADGETFGRIFIEAAACGVPSIATRSGAAPEIVLDRKTGWLSSNNCVDDFSSTVLEALSDPNFIRKVGGDALNFSSTFGLDTHCKKILKAYQKVLDT